MNIFGRLFFHILSQSSRWLFVSIGLAVFSIGCSDQNPAKQPEWVARQFFEAVKRGDYETAKKWATKETQATLAFQEKLGAWGYNPFEKEVEILGHTQAGQHARVTFRIEGRPGEDQLQLRKTGNGEWRVRISKVDPASEKGVNFVYDWLEDSVPAEKRWEALDSISSAQEPAATAHRFLTALEKDDIALARTLSSTETRLILDAQQAMGNWSNPFVDQQFRLTGSEIMGDSARIIFRQRNNNRPRILRMAQSEGKWMVNITLDNMQDFLLENTAMEWMKPLQQWYQEMDKWKAKLNL